MELIFASNAGMARARLRKYIAACKADHPEFTVLDIGGAANPWSGADCYVDIHEVEGQPTIIGDIHDPAIWHEITDRKFDFCVCSHVLEDIRDPLFVLGKIRETFSHGYIAVPNKHVEFGHIESKQYVGYGHHRWIFTLVDNELRVIAKFPFASYYSPRRYVLMRVRASAPVRALRERFRIPAKIRDQGPLRWWQRDRSSAGNELAFVWRGVLNFKAINADYAGANISELARLYREELAIGL
jgi:hypothetical protein